MEIFAIIGLLISYFKYRAAKADRSLAVDGEVPDEENCGQQPLRPEAGRLERLAHWLGLNEN
jgi:hypothetical protein